MYSEKLQEIDIASMSSRSVLAHHVCHALVVECLNAEVARHKSEYYGLVKHRNSILIERASREIVAFDQLMSKTFIDIDDTIQGLVKLVEDQFEFGVMLGRSSRLVRETITRCAVETEIREFVQDQRQTDMGSGGNPDPLTEEMQFEVLLRLIGNLDSETDWMSIARQYNSICRANSSAITLEKK